MKTLVLKNDNWIICPDISDVERVERIFKERGFQADARDINHAIQLWRFGQGELSMDLQQSDVVVFDTMMIYFKENK